MTNSLSDWTHFALSGINPGPALTKKYDYVYMDIKEK